MDKVESHAWTDWIKQYQWEISFSPKCPPKTSRKKALKMWLNFIDKLNIKRWGKKHYKRYGLGINNSVFIEKDKKGLWHFHVTLSGIGKLSYSSILRLWWSIGGYREGINNNAEKSLFDTKKRKIKACLQKKQSKLIQGKTINEIRQVRNAIHREKQNALEELRAKHLIENRRIVTQYNSDWHPAYNSKQGDGLVWIKNQRK